LEVADLQLDEIRSILLSERETGRLLAIPRDLYPSTDQDLQALLDEVYASEDPFSDSVRVLIERIGSIRETLHDLFVLRSEKILTLARTQEEGQYIDRDELKRLLPEEREMFDTVIMAIGQSRCRLIPTAIARAGMNRAQAAEESERCAQIIATEEKAASEIALSRVLTDMEPFMGVDGRIYQLRHEDIVTLPLRNAEVLCERNIVMNIRPSALQ
jgi:DNA replication factor GINS